MEIYNTVRLPNGGEVAMDKLAYESYTGVGASTHGKKWSVTLYFDNDNKETTECKPELNDMIEIR